MKYRIFRLIFLKQVDGESAEQFLASEEIVLKRRNEQALAKAARAAEEIYFPICHKVIYQCRLVYIHVTVLTYLLKVLYAYWVLHSYAFCKSLTKIDIFSLSSKEIK